jgi:hypothetical protein
MLRKSKTGRVALAAAALVALAALLAAPMASAHSGVYAEFNKCPSTNPAVKGCLYSNTYGGEVILGSKTVPIVNPVVLQGGVGKADPATGNEQFYAPTSGPALQPVAQPLPGGLAGLVNCKQLGLLRGLCETVFENGLTGVNTTLELAKPASAITVNEGSIVFQSGVGLVLPVKVHLENPLLGSTCYIGSESEPIIWNLTTGKTSPPAPNTSISGTAGKAEAVGEDEGILRLNGATLVDNAWAAPGAHGCGSFLGVLGELILDPVINAASGVPAKAGHNTAKLITVSDAAEAELVNEH